jgi:N-acetylmuramoyl-L-alanine amidase
VRRQLFLCAGHTLGGGAEANGLRESPYNAKVAVLAVQRLRDAGCEARMVPLSRRRYPAEIWAKTAWINRYACPGDLAVEVHLDINEPGCAAFAIEEPISLAAADLLAQHLSSATGLRCRGGMGERETAAGRLGFVRGVRCLGLVAELCSMNTTDVLYATAPGARSAFADGLASGCLAILESLPAPRAQALTGSPAGLENNRPVASYNPAMVAGSGRVPSWRQAL